MEHVSARKWAIRWLLAVCAVHVAVGALLPWVGGATLFDGYHRGIETAFWPGGAPIGARSLQTWWIALFGPTVQLMAAVCAVGWGMVNATVTGTVAGPTTGAPALATTLATAGGSTVKVAERL